MLCRRKSSPSFVRRLSLVAMARSPLSWTLLRLDAALTRTPRVSFHSPSASAPSSSSPSSKSPDSLPASELVFKALLRLATEADDERELPLERGLLDDGGFEPPSVSVESSERLR